MRDDIGKLRYLSPYFSMLLQLVTMEDVRENPVMVGGCSKPNEI